MPFKLIREKNVNSWANYQDDEKSESIRDDGLIPLELPLPIPGESPYPSQQPKPEKYSHRIEIDMN